jgi:hypothetical protein
MITKNFWCHLSFLFGKPTIRGTGTVTLGFEIPPTTIGENRHLIYKVNPLVLAQKRFFTN